MLRYGETWSSFHHLPHLIQRSTLGEALNCADPMPLPLKQMKTPTELLQPCTRVISNHLPRVLP